MLKNIVLAAATFALLAPVAASAKDHEKDERRGRAERHEHADRHEHGDRDRGEHRHHRRDHRGWYHCGGIWVPILGVGCDFDD